MLWGLREMRRILINVIRLYQRWVSRLKRAPSCRFYPSCSEYAVLAIGKYGALKGTALGIWRVIRCNPWNSGGIDFP